MRIALDARILAGSRSGIARYTVGLLKGWSRRFPDDAWAFVTHRDIPAEELGLSPDIRRLVARFPDATVLRPVWEQLFLPGAVARLEPPPDLFFSPLGALLPGEGLPSVATVHDLAFIRYPHILPARYRIYWRLTVQRAVRHAARIVAVSESTARDLRELLGADPDRIRVVHEGVDDEILAEPTAEQLAAIRERHRLPERFVLFVGTLEPRKNVDFLLDAYEASFRTDASLVLAGGWGWLSDGLRARISAMSKPPVLLGEIPMDVLSCLYRMATVLAFPSRYEGFGLPLVEAMAAGLPIVAVRSSSVPEVVGDAAWLVEPGDTEGFGAAVQTLLAEPDRRAAFSKQGRTRSAGFSWEKAAARTRAVFEEVLTRSG